MKGKVIFVGAGPGDPDLITFKGRKVIENADVIIYAGSLVNKNVLCPAKEECVIHNNAYLNLEETDEIITEAVSQGKLVARVHTGDPSIYGAIGEQIRELKKHDIEYDIIPGVSSLFGNLLRSQVELIHFIEKLNKPLMPLSITIKCLKGIWSRSVRKKCRRRF